MNEGLTPSTSLAEGRVPIVDRSPSQPEAVTVVENTFVVNHFIGESALIDPKTGLRAGSIKYHIVDTDAQANAVRVKTLGNVTRFGTPSAKVIPPPAPSLPSMDRLRRLADLLPMTSRKAMKALVGDYYQAARELEAEGRTKAAYWNIAMAWWFSGCIFAGAPLGAVLKFFVKTLKG